MLERDSTTSELAPLPQNAWIKDHLTSNRIRAGRPCYLQLHPSGRSEIQDWDWWATHGRRVARLLRRGLDGKLLSSTSRRCRASHSSMCFTSAAIGATCNPDPDILTWTLFGLLLSTPPSAKDYESLSGFNSRTIHFSRNKLRFR